MSAAYDRPDDPFEVPIPETSKRRTREQSQLEFELDFLGRVLERDPLFGDALKVHADNLAAKGYYNRALQADRIRVGGAVRLLNEFHSRGEIRLIGARISGTLDLSGAHIDAPGGDHARHATLVGPAGGELLGVRERDPVPDGLGLAAAYWAMGLLTRLIPADMMAGMPYLHDLGLNHRIVTYAGVISLFAAVLFSLTPSLRVSLSQMRAGMAEGSRGSSGSRPRSRGCVRGRRAR